MDQRAAFGGLTSRVVGNEKLTCKDTGSLRGRDQRLAAAESQFGMKEPSDLAITIALLRFGALGAPEKLRVLDDYQKRCREQGGGPHVWNPSVEAIESLWRNMSSYECAVRFADVGDEERRIFAEIASVADKLLDKQVPDLVDGSSFQSAVGQKLSSLSRDALGRLASHQEEELSFWDLMCFTCD
jgi:hypothetical protein